MIGHATAIVLVCAHCSSGVSPDTVLAIGALAFFALLYATVTRRRSLGSPTWTNRCTRCDYQLSGLGVKPACPECGLRDAGRVEPLVSVRLSPSPVRCAFCFAVLALCCPVVIVNMSVLVWQGLYMADWGRIPVAVEPASGVGALVLCIGMLPLLARALDPWEDHGVWRAALVSAAGFWVAQPFGLLVDWQSGRIQPGGQAMPVAAAAGLLLGFLVARVLTPGAAILRPGRIRSSRAARSHALGSQPSPPPPAVRPTTPSPTPTREPST